MLYGWHKLQDLYTNEILKKKLLGRNEINLFDAVNQVIFFLFNSSFRIDSIEFEWCCNMFGVSTSKEGITHQLVGVCEENTVVMYL